jgi:hypothetical protein
MWQHLFVLALNLTVILLFIDVQRQLRLRLRIACYPPPASSRIISTVDASADQRSDIVRSRYARHGLIEDAGGDRLRPHAVGRRVFARGMSPAAVVEKASTSMDNRL